MSVLYHLMIPQPQTPSLDAVVQEAEALRMGVGGEIVYLNPARRPGSRYPERLYGMHRLLYLRRKEATVRLHHVYNPHPLAFPYLRWLRRPIIYSVTAGLGRQLRPGHLDKLKQWSAIVVSNSRDQLRLQSYGLDNVHVILPGIDTSLFEPMPPPERTPFTLLAASAPWTEEQFHSKGVDTLLAAVQEHPDLNVVFLWRGLLLDAMQERVANRGLQGKVKVISQFVDVNQILADVHAAVVLSTDSTLVKAFPHSLLEALAAGKPVLVSRTLPMADYVTETGCGLVVESVDAAGILDAIAQLELTYETCRKAALIVGRRDFDRAALVEAFQRLYEKHG